MVAVLTRRTPTERDELDVDSKRQAVAPLQAAESVIPNLLDFRLDLGGGIEALTGVGIPYFYSLQTFDLDRNVNDDSASTVTVVFATAGAQARSSSKASENRANVQLNRVEIIARSFFDQTRIPQR
jgi:hypothetical protein